MALSPVERYLVPKITDNIVTQTFFDVQRSYQYERMRDWLDDFEGDFDNTLQSIHNAWIAQDTETCFETIEAFRAQILPVVGECIAYNLGTGISEGLQREDFSWNQAFLNNFTSACHDLRSVVQEVSVLLRPADVLSQTSSHPSVESSSRPSVGTLSRPSVGTLSRPSVGTRSRPSVGSISSARSGNGNGGGGNGNGGRGLGGAGGGGRGLGGAGGNGNGGRGSGGAGDGLGGGNGNRGRGLGGGGWFRRVACCMANPPRD